MIRVELPYPHKLLWPNGSRGHVQSVASEKRKHKLWADLAALEAVQIAGIATRYAEYCGGSVAADTPPLRLNFVIHAKPKGPLPDRDNCVAAAKAYLDGIAQRLGVNDRMFAAPTVEFATPRNGRFVIEVGG